MIMELSANDILKFLTESGKLDLSYVQDEMIMEQRKKVLEMYGGCIWYSKKENVWYCHLPDENRENGRRKIKRKNKKDIENVVYEYYKSKPKSKQDITLQMLFEEFFEYKAKLVSSNTVKRMLADWKKFYADSEIIKIDAKELTKIDIDSFFNETLDKHKLNAKAFHNMCGILKQMLEYMVDAEYIEQNPYRTKVNKKKFAAPVKKTAETEVYQSDEKQIFIDEMERRLRQNPRNTAPLAVMLDFEIGARKGEVLALNEHDITDGWIHIHRQVIEKFDISDLEHIKSIGFEVADYTKSDDGDRWIPLTDMAMELISRVQEINKNNGDYFNGFLFIRDGHIMSPDAIDAQVKRGCEYIGMNVKTMHKIRKTYGSTLLHNGVNVSAVKDMLGHADETTTLKHYIFNTMNDEETGKAVRNALNVDKVTKSDQKVIIFTGKRKAENPAKSRLSAK